MSRITNAIIWKICFIVPNENKHLYSINMDAQNQASQSSVSDLTLKLTEIPFKFKKSQWNTLKMWKIFHAFFTLLFSTAFASLFSD